MYGQNRGYRPSLMDKFLRNTPAINHWPAPGSYPSAVFLFFFLLRPQLPIMTCKAAVQHRRHESWTL